MRGEPVDDAAAAKLIDHCKPAQLTAGETEAFAAPEEESNARLARAAVALGLLLPRLEESALALTELGIDTTLLSGPWPAELWRAMTAVAQDLLAGGRYAEAQRLAAVRGRHLDEHRASFAFNTDEQPCVKPVLAKVGSTGVPVSAPLRLLIFVALLALAFWQWPFHATRTMPTSLLTELSPHLVAAYESSDDGVMRLVGTVGERWAQLTDPERQQLVRELGGRVEAFGIGDLILIDQRNNIQGRYGDGEILWLARSHRGAGSDD